MPKGKSNKKNEEKQDNHNTKYRFFASIYYPEDRLFSEVVSYLTSHQIPCFISPEHKPEGEGADDQKKVHRHILFIFDGPRRLEWLKLALSVVNINHVQWVTDAHAYARYLIHLDDPDKEQFENGSSEIQTIGSLNYDYWSAPKYTYTEKYDEIITFVYENDVLSFANFVMWCKVNKPEWFTLIVRKSSFQNTLLNIMRSLTYAPRLQLFDTPFGDGTPLK